jgi:hypothetical protein
VRRAVALSSSSSNNNSDVEDGEVGSGPNWIERSFPVAEKIDAKKVDDYDLGIDGMSLGTGALSGRMFQAIMNRSSLPTDDPEIRRALKIYAMDFTAKEATRAALKQNGLEMVLNDDEQDEGMWGDVDSIRLLDDNDGRTRGDMYDSWEEAVDHWTPGQGFSFVVRQVPAKMMELSIDQLLQALDPDGSFRKEAKEKGMKLPDEEITSLRDMATENKYRTNAAPQEAVAESDAFAGTDSAGYRVIQARDLSENSDLERTIMHVMDAFVSHGCLIVDLTNSGESFEKAAIFSEMWNAVDKCFEQIHEKESSILPGMQPAQETGSQHAMVGFASYADGSLQFLETRQSRSGELLPPETKNVIGEEGCRALQSAFDIVADIGKHVVKIVVAASTEESGALGGDDARVAATKLANELLDDGKLLQSDIHHSEGSVSMSPHRLCRYSKSSDQNLDEAVTSEIFGSHTDSTFITAGMY